MNDITLNITVSEGKLIFKALVELPFKLVFELIGNINQQTNAQQRNNESDEIVLKLNKREIEIIKEALVEQPFKMVFSIFEKISKVESI